MKKLVWVFMALLSGCGSIDRQPIPLLSSHGAAAPDCRDLLVDYEAYAYMDAKAREGFRREVRQQWALTRNSCEQLRLALVYSQGDSTQRARALKLVEELLESGNLARYLRAQGLALLLRDALNRERKQLLHSVQLQHLLYKQQARNQAQARALEDLQTQLRQLKQIEQNINEKEQSLIPPATNPLAPGAAPHPGGG